MYMYMGITVFSPPILYTCFLLHAYMYMYMCTYHVQCRYALIAVVTCSMFVCVSPL